MFTDTDLRDPAPPTPGAAERAAVASRAKQLKRNHRLGAAGGALGLVAVLSLGVVALAGGGSSGSSAKIQTAAAPTTEAVVTTLPPAPAPDATAAEAPATTEAPAPTEAAAPAPATFTVSGTISNIPEGATLTVTLRGDAGTFSAVADASGNVSISGVPAGTYSADYQWVAGGAAQVGRLPAVTVSGDTSFGFSF
jgi:hypothetical protein